MGRYANLSPLGLFQWDKSIFDLMVIPSALNRDTLLDNILAETAELEVIYPNPVVFKNLVGVWSQKQIDIWNRLYETTQYEYNPIENYNRYETGSTDGTDTTTDRTSYEGTDIRTENINHGGSDKESSTSRVSDSGTDSSEGESTKGHYIAGFDSSASGDDDGLVKQTRDEEETSNTITYGKIENGTGNRTTNYGKTEEIRESRDYGQSISKTGNATHGGTHTLHAHGNIGVMSTQEMVKLEREVDRFNLYDIIIEEFKMRFCILVY